MKAYFEGKELSNPFVAQCCRRRAHTADGNIIIAAAEDGEAAVYDFTGRLIKSVPVASGNSTAVPVTPGYYIVKTGTKTQSVVVK